MNNAAIEATPKKSWFGRAFAAWEFLVFFGIAAAIITQLFIPPVIGVADNGDYHRVMGPMGLEPTVTEWADCYFDHVNLQYREGPARAATFPTSQLLMGKAALAVDKWVVRGDTFSLTTLGGVNTAVYLIGLALILLHLRRLTPAARIVGGVFLFLMSTDVSNVSFFNSFYSESASLIFLVLLIGWFVAVNRAERIRVWHFLGYFLIAAAFVAAKPQNHPLAVPVVLIAGVWLWRAQHIAGRLVFAGGSILLLVFTANLYLAVPQHIKGFNCWNVLFYSILVDSPDPRADLTEFGLDPELAAFAGQGAFAEGVPLVEVAGKIHHSDLAAFFLRHPGRLLGLASACSKQIYVKLDPLNGHFEKSSGFAAREQSRSFSVWQQFQASALPRSIGWLVFLSALLIAGVGTVLFKHGIASSEGAVAWLAGGLGLMAAMEFGICVLGDGTYDIVKHLFLFQVLLDACFLAGAVWLADMATELAE
jgi:hypothetical protein